MKSPSNDNIKHDGYEKFLALAATFQDLSSAQISCMTRACSPTLFANFLWFFSFERSFIDAQAEIRRDEIWAQNCTKKEEKQ